MKDHPATDKGFSVGEGSIKEDISKTEVEFQACKCSISDTLHYHIDSFTIIPWDIFIKEVKRFRKQGLPKLGVYMLSDDRIRGILGHGYEMFPVQHDLPCFCEEHMNIYRKLVKEAVEKCHDLMCTCSPGIKASGCDCRASILLRQ